MVGPRFSGFRKDREGSVSLLKRYQERNILALHIADPFKIEGKVVYFKRIKGKAGG